jgi:hypothetical protein
MSVELRLNCKFSSSDTSGVNNMATTPSVKSNAAQNTTNQLTYTHQFHAEAHVLSGELKSPIEQRIEKHARVALKNERGGHLTRFLEDVSIEGLVYFRNGFTRVSGGESLKHKAWVTLSTSVMEGLNVFEILTADRVVSQVSTEHTQDAHGHVPRVTFLGTQFVNLRLCGFPITVTLDLNVCGEKPTNDQSYLTNEDFLRETRKRVDRIANCGFLPEAVKTLYDDRLGEIDGLLKGQAESKITCSLVKSIKVDHDNQIPGLNTIENVLVLRDFGAVSFGEVEVGIEAPTKANDFRRPKQERHNGQPQPSSMSNYFEVTMLNMELGCVGSGSVKVGQSKTNGQTSP